MTLYLPLKIKSLLKNKHLIFWSIVFVDFWVVLWFFVFSRGSLPSNMVIYNEAAAFAYLGIISIASLAVSFTYAFGFQATALRYLTRFTRLTPGKYLLEDTVASLVTYALVIAILYISVSVCTYLKYHVVPSPANVPGLIVCLLACGVLLHVMSIFLALLCFAIGAPRSINYVSAIPLMVGFIAYGTCFAGYGPATEAVAYANPFNVMAYLILYYFTGKVPPVASYFEYVFSTYLMHKTVSVPLVDLRLAAISLIVWIVALSLISLFLVRKIRALSVYELMTA